MGIGNTTAASTILAAITGLPVAEVTGRGTGIDDATWNHKVAVIEQALQANQPDASDPLDVLAKVGGLEIAGLVGLALGAAARRVPILVDGFIATVAALVAAELCPAARGYMIAAHRSVEIGHRVALERLELEALFAFDLRLGEGTGAALALPTLYAALAILDEMATFEEAGVSSGPSHPGRKRHPITSAAQGQPGGDRTRARPHGAGHRLLRREEHAGRRAVPLAGPAWAARGAIQGPEHVEQRGGLRGRW